MFRNIPHGLYRIWFADCDEPCLASVGSTHDGTRWYAPCNWTSGNNRDPVVASTDWSVIRNAELIEPAYGESEGPGIYTRELTAAEIESGVIDPSIPWQ